MKNNSSTRVLMYPFAAPDSMNEIMQFVRHPSWKQDINIALLKKMGIATNNEGKVTSALKFLGIIDDTGAPTGEFDKLKKDYQPTLQGLVRSSYSELFGIFTADMITRSRLLSFFGEPKQGAERRARLFVWLCKETEIDLPSLDASEHNNANKKSIELQLA